MESKITIIDDGQEIIISDLDGCNEVDIHITSKAKIYSELYLSKESIIAIKKHLDYLVAKF